MEHRKPSPAAAAAESVLPITRFSQLGEPPEAVGWWRPVGIVFVVILAVLITVVVGAAALPLVLLFTLARRLYFCRVTYHTQPKEVKIAVIGGGWSGCQSMARFKELGVAQVTGFERHEVGKTAAYKSNSEIAGLVSSTLTDRLPLITLAYDMRFKHAKHPLFVKTYAVRFLLCHAQVP